MKSKMNLILFHQEINKELYISLHLECQSSHQRLSVHVIAQEDKSIVNSDTEDFLGLSSSATSTVPNGTPSSTPTSTEEHECYILLLLGFEDNIGCPQEDWAIATPQLSGKLPFQVKAPFKCSAN